MRRSTIATATLALILATGSASAATVGFTGSLFNTNPPPAPNASCAPGTVLLQFDPGNSVQNSTSNFGGFVASAHHCIGGFPFASWTNGAFLWSFDLGDTLFGTTFGNLTPTATPGLFDATYSFVATGGTGRFLNASGSVAAIAQIDTRFAPTTNTGTLRGSLVLPGVPEPAAWAMFITGFGLVGALSRRTKRPRLAVVAR